MIKQFAMLLIIAFCVSGAISQTTPSKVPSLSPEQQTEFQTAQNRVVLAGTALQAAQRDFDIAAAIRDRAVFRIMAQLQLSPDKYDALTDKDGKLIFVEKPKTPDKPKE